MCFSANASFGAGIILGVAGVIAVKKAQPQQRLFAAIPLLFSVQQFSEGIVWLTLNDPQYAAWQQTFIHIFLVFAYVVWPIWIPLTIMLAEKNRKRKKILLVLLATGIFISLYIAGCLLAYPVDAFVTKHHIKYTFDYPPVLHNLTWLSDAFYFIATIIAPFVSSLKKMWLFGLIIIGSYTFSKFFYNDAVISVWCYLAAALSIVILIIIYSNRSASKLVRAN